MILCKIFICSPSPLPDPRGDKTSASGAEMKDDLMVREGIRQNRSHSTLPLQVLMLSKPELEQKGSSNFDCSWSFDYYLKMEICLITKTNFGD